MTGSRNPEESETPFLRVDQAEIVHGPSVIAGKVSEALKDADRFGLPEVKPPLGEALERVRQVAASIGSDEAPPAEQNALEGRPAEVDDRAGSAEKLQSDAAQCPENGSE